MKRVYILCLELLPDVTHDILCIKTTYTMVQLNETESLTFGGN